MCFIQESFSQDLSQLLAKKISLQPKIGNFNIVLPPRLAKPNNLEISCALSVTALILHREYNLFPENLGILEAPINTVSLTIAYTADYLVSLAKAVAPHSFLKPISKTTLFGKTRICFSLLEAVVNLFTNVLKGILSPKFDTSKIQAIFNHFAPPLSASIN